MAKGCLQGFMHFLGILVGFHDFVVRLELFGLSRGSKERKA